ncbi:hypothetical protein MLOOGBEN_20715 [Bacillus sp. EB106-08-02-XG196]|jgi:hypothetical protein|uniref:hypothetical protein n=1 Tax=Bacillus sp. EB106-08-02-XG196 TaxID=2737049 RepID=UPI0015C4E209|nr:hypothetical protein [Bacillus sp. EB106-08-02-XG196]NWQ43124.1 hypothetical protein [Bacillus sp. EB106-08-02-XG196]
MYYYHYPYPPYPQHPAYPGYYFYPPVTRQYPQVDVNIFTKSIKSYRLLMDQGSILLDRLGDEGFDVKLMSFAQQGNKTEVDKLIKTIGLKVPVETKYTPTGITFELTAHPDPSTPLSCCTLSVHMKWGN